jgi:SecD/SecF fusion protein
MRSLISKLLLVLIILVLCVWSLYPPEKIKLGKDLRGGVSMVYAVNIPEGADGLAVLTQVAEVLKDRINPTGMMDLTIQPQGVDRLEIVSPLPGPEVRAFQEAYRSSLDALLAKAAIDTAELEEALRSGQAAERFAGRGPVTDMAKSLQEAFNTSRSLRAELQGMLDSSSGGGSADPAAVSTLEGRIAESELAEERLRRDLMALSIDQARLVRAFGLSDEPLVLKDELGVVVLDENRVPKRGPSAREIELTEIKTQFPHLATSIDQVSSAYDAYAVQRTGLDDPEDLKRLLRGAGVLEFHIAVRASRPESLNIEQLRAQLAAGGPSSVDSSVAGWFMLNKLEQWYENDLQRQALEADPISYFASQDKVAGAWQGNTYLLLWTTPSMSLTHDAGLDWSMERVGRTNDQLGRPAVSFSLDQAGGREMGRLTGPNVGQFMAIVLDGQVYSAPVLQSQITGSGVITGGFSDQELDYLVRVLAAGALSARLSPEPISTSILGPSIGGDNLRRGLEACVLAVIVVAAIMLAYYWVAGVFATISIACMCIMIFGIMAMLNTAFTLPGLAGVALTIGMAVDCNVLIYERIREEMLDNGEDLRSAVRIAFKRVFDTVVDGQLTNLIVCIVLVQVATAEVKGFGVAMIVGVMSTLFAALVITRLCFTIYTDVFKFRSLPMLPTAFPAVHRLLEPTFDWMARRKLFFAGSALVCAIGAALFLWQGKNVLDTEFRGGVSVTMSLRAAAPGEPAHESGRLLLPRAEVEQVVRAVGESNAGDPVLSQLRSASVLTVGDTTPRFEASTFQIKVSNPAGASDDQDIASDIQQSVIAAFRDRLDVAPELRFAGSDDDEGGTRHTFPIERDRLGDNIGMPRYADPVGNFLGGVAIVLDGVQPPVRPEDALKRIQRMRQQPDFASQLGREVRVVGLEPADPGEPSAGFKSIAVLVRDPEVDIRRTDLALFDQKLAGPEWRLVSRAMTQASSLEQVSSFSSAVARTLLAQAVVAIALSVLGILLYVWFRFASLRYSVAALVATAHDVIVALAALALTHYLANTALGRMLLIEEFRIDLNVVAGLLTLIGYSLNDTIVIMDRIRENRGKLPYATTAVINKSLNQTFSRTVLTGVTTLAALLILYIEGGGGIRAFSFVLIIGLLTGTYSSIAIAAPLVWTGDTVPEQASTRRRATGASARALPAAG